MIYREFDRIDKGVSLLGLGSMRFPTFENGEIDEEHVKKMVEYAMNNGVTYYDHAWFYHDYKSETLMGRVLSKYDRSKFFIADKMPLWECKSEDDVEKLFAQQLVNLQTDYIDYYLVHAMSKDRIKQYHEFKVEEKLLKWKAEGKIRHIGFSFHDDLETFYEVVDLFDWDFSLIQLNYIDVNHQQGIIGYEELKKRNIPAFIMEPVKGGNLANFNDEINQLFLDYNPNVSIASWAIRWLANLDNVAMILSGMSSFDQMVDNINTVSNFSGMNKEELAIIEKAKQMINDRVKVNCTGCNYCMPCPYGVNIPKSFSVLNDFSMYQNEKFLKWSYGLLVRDKQLPSLCVECGICVPNCPQNLDIPNLLKGVVEIDPR